MWVGVLGSVRASVFESAHAKVLDKAAQHALEIFPHLLPRFVLLRCETAPAVRAPQSRQDFSAGAFRVREHVREAVIARLLESLFHVRQDRVVRLRNLIPESAISAQCRTLENCINCITERAGVLVHGQIFNSFGHVRPYLTNHAEPEDGIRDLGFGIWDSGFGIRDPGFGMVDEGFEDWG